MSKDYTVEVLFRFYVPVEDAESVDEAIAVATDEATLGEMLVGAKPIVGEISEGIA